MSLMVFVDVKQYGQACESEFRSCVKVEMAVLVPNEPYVVDVKPVKRVNQSSGAV